MYYMRFTFLKTKSSYNKDHSSMDKLQNPEIWQVCTAYCREKDQADGLVAFLVIVAGIVLGGVAVFMILGKEILKVKNIVRMCKKQ